MLHGDGHGFFENQKEVVGVLKKLRIHEKKMRMRAPRLNLWGVRRRSSKVHMIGGVGQKSTFVQKRE